MKKFLAPGLILIISALPLAYLAIVWPQLPQTVPTHFGFDGKADGFSDKRTLIYLVLFMSLISAGIFFLLKNLHKIDPKKGAKFSRNLLNKLAIAQSLFMTVIAFMMVYSAIKGQLQLNALFLPVMGIFFAYLGNLMYSIKPNYFVGIRTPWALENEETWRKTHQLAGKLWFAGGIIITIAAFLLPARYSGTATILIVTTIVIVPVVFSYVFFRRVNSNQNA